MYSYMQATVNDNQHVNMFKDILNRVRQREREREEGERGEGEKREREGDRRGR